MNMSATNIIPNWGMFIDPISGIAYRDGKPVGYKEQLAFDEAVSVCLDKIVSKNEPCHNVAVVRMLTELDKT